MLLKPKILMNLKTYLHRRDTAKTSRMMEIYTFAKDCNISIANGDRLLKLLNDNKGYTSWKTFDRWILKQTDFYHCVKKNIKWPNHWQMNKWNHSNIQCPEEVEIRIRDIIQIVADQCVSPHIQFLWKEDIQIKTYRKQNKINENVFCDIMSSDWACEEQEEITKFDRDGLLLAMMHYYDGVSPDNLMKTSLSPVMGTLGFYGRKLLQNYCSKFPVGYI